MGLVSADAIKNNPCSLFSPPQKFRLSPPRLFNGHRSFPFYRDPPSVSTTLHRHLLVSRRSFFGHVHVESLSSLSVACITCTRVVFTGLCSSWRLPTWFLHRLTVRGCVQIVSRGSVFSSRNPTLRPCRFRMMSRPRPRAPRGFLIWYLVMWRRHWR